MTLRHVERVPSFVVEGHLYEAADGRRFHVFTAGDGSIWTATEVDDSDRTFGRYVITAAPSRATCVKRLKAYVQP